MNLFCCGFLLLITTFSPTVFANPVGGQVSVGQATISAPNSNTVWVNQTSNKAVIDWHTFNIATQELIKFQQPTTNSIILNRVNPANGASTILGRISANGQVWLINPAGVLIGSTARIDTGGLLITTANIRNEDFMASHYHFVQSPDWNRAVINQGHISTVADNGLVTLVAPGVENSGVIEANFGSVVLAAGKEFTVDFYGDQLIHFGINSQVTEKVTAPDGKILSSGVYNSGKIIAHGGKVILTAQTASDVMDQAINMDGYIEGKSAVAKNGEVILNGNTGIVQVSGKINVASKAKKQTGGTVKLLGSKIAIVGNATINASGSAGGGEILIGGNAHGAGHEPNADYVYFGRDANVNASALANGNGGKVVVWANSGTQFYGNIQARGGINSGNGGWVETSGKENLSFAGYVNTSAIHGNIGTLLLDPTDITIQTGGAVYTPPYDFTTSGGVTILASGANSLSAQTSAVILNAHNNITFSNGVNMAAGGSLELHAGKTITINANISTTNGGITMTANDAAATAANRTAGAGNITMGAGTSLNAGTADISLTINPTATGGFTPGTLGLRGLTANNITINGTSTSSTVTFNGNVTTTSNMNITSGGAITQAAATALTGNTLIAKTLKNAPGSAITLGNAGNDFTTVNLQARNAADSANSSGSITYRDATGVNIAAISTSSNITSFTTGGPITQSGAITVTGTSTFNAGANAIDLSTNGSSNSFTGAVSLTNSGSNTISINNSTALVLGTSNIGQNFSARAGGNITQTGALTVAGNSTFAVTAGTSNISLNTQANNFIGIVSYAGTLANIQDIGLRNTNSSAAVSDFSGITNLRNLTLVFNNAAINLPFLRLAATGNLAVTAGGAITQTGALTVPGTANFNAGGNPIDLSTNGASNSFTGAVTLTTTGTNNVSLNNNRSLVLAASSIGKNLIITTAGAITQTGALTIAGTSSFNSGSAAITLTTAANAFTGTVSLTNTAGTIALTKTGALTIGTVNAGGNLNLTATGAMSQTGRITATGGTTTLAAGAANNINFSNSSNDFATVAITTGKDVTLTDTNAIVLGTSTISGNYSVTAGGNITQSGVLTVTGPAAFSLTNAATDILLSTQANNFTGTVGFGGNLSNIRNVSLRNTNAAANFPGFSGVTNLQNLTLLFNNTGIIFPALVLTNGGSLTVTTGGAISQTGAITVPGTATFNVGPNTISLTNTSNAFASAVSLTNSGANDVALTNNIPLVLGASTIAGGNLNIIANGDITQTGAIIANGTLKKATFSAGISNDITLSTPTNNFTIAAIGSANNATLRDINAIIMDTSTVSGTLDITAGNTITQNGTLTSRQLTAKTLLNTGGAITLNNAGNNVTTINLKARNTSDTANAAGAISYRNATGLDIVTIATTSTINLTTGGAITDSGNISGTTLTTHSIGGTFLDFGSNLTGFNGTNTTSGNIQLTNTGNLNITGISQLGGGNVMISNTGTTAITGTVNTGTGNTALTSTGAVTQTAPIISPILIVTTLNNTPAAITLNNAGNETATINLQTRNAANTATVAGAITYRDATGFNVANANTTSTVTLTAGNTITQSSAIGGTTLSVKTLNNVGANIILNNTNNSFTNVSLQTRNAADTVDVAGTIFYQGISGVNLTALRTLGSATLIAGGAMTESANMNVGGTLTATSVGGTLFNNPNTIANFNVTNTGGGVITLTNTAALLTITGLTNTGSGAVTITNTGILAIADGVTVDTGNAPLVLTATDLSLNTTGAINSGSADTSITQSTVGGAIYLGEASGTGMAIKGNALQRMTANNLIFNAPNNGQIIVDNLTAADTANITNSLRLSATAGDTGSITVGSHGATFKALTANADNGITINGNLVTTTGNLALDADFNGIAAGNDALALNANLTAAGTMTLSASNGGIILGTPVTLNANGITINSPLNGIQALTLDAGATGNIVFNANIGNVNPLTALNILNVNNLTNNAIITTVSYKQNAGNGIVNFGAGGLHATSVTTMTANTVNGAITVSSLSLGTQFANLTGTVAGLSGTAAIKGITLLNTIGPGTHFFDGIDMYTPAPIPPKPPTTSANNEINPTLIFLYTLTQSGATNNPYTAVMHDYDLSLDTAIQPEANAKNCVKLSSDISVCSK